MGKVMEFSGLTDQEKLANFLSLTHSDCSLDGMPETVPPLSGQPTQKTYMDEAAAILKLLRIGRR